MPMKFIINRKNMSSKYEFRVLSKNISPSSFIICNIYTNVYITDRNICTTRSKQKHNNASEAPYNVITLDRQT